MTAEIVHINPALAREQDVPLIKSWDDIHPNKRYFQALDGGRIYMRRCPEPLTPEEIAEWAASGFAIVEYGPNRLAELRQQK